MPFLAGSCRGRLLLIELAAVVAVTIVPDGSSDPRTVDDLDLESAD